MQAPIVCPKGCKSKLKLGTSLCTGQLQLPDSLAQAQVKPLGNACPVKHCRTCVARACLPSVSCRGSAMQLVQLWLWAA